MPTRFYLPSTGDAAVSPTYSSLWEYTSEATRRELVTTKISSAMTDAGAQETVATSSIDVLIRQYVSQPLPAQTISGNVKGQIRAYEFVADNDLSRAVLIRVCSNDGSTIRGTLLEHFPSSLTSEFNTSLQNRYFPPSTGLSSLAIQEGDRIVIEYGYRAFNSHSSDSVGWLNFGDNSGTDLPENETATTSDNPWIEFSIDINLAVLKTITDSGSIVDNIDLIKQEYKFITESGSIADSISVIKPIDKYVSEIGTLTDTAMAVFKLHMINEITLLSDSIGVSEVGRTNFYISDSGKLEEHIILAKDGIVNVYIQEIGYISDDVYVGNIKDSKTLLYNVANNRFETSSIELPSSIISIIKDGKKIELGGYERNVVIMRRDYMDFDKPITGTIRTKDYNLGDNLLHKVVRRVNLHLVSGDETSILQVYLVIDGEIKGVIPLIVNYDEKEEIKIYEIVPSCVNIFRCKHVGFIFIQEGKKKGITIRGITIEYWYENRRAHDN